MAGLLTTPRQIALYVPEKFLLAEINIFNPDVRNNFLRGSGGVSAVLRPSHSSWGFN